MYVFFESTRWVGFLHSLLVGHGKCLRPIIWWVGGVKKGQKHAYVILEWSLTHNWFIQAKQVKQASS
jgi:hypothetical protein